MSAYDDAVLVDIPEIFWPLDDAGPTAVDLSGNGYDGTVVEDGGGTVTFGEPGLTVVDGATAVRLSNDDTSRAFLAALTWPPSPLTLTEFTVEIICRAADVRHSWGYSLIAGIYGNLLGTGTWSEIDIEIGSTSQADDDALGYYLQMDSHPGWVDGYDSFAGYVADTTYHLALVWTGGMSQFYVNGVLVRSEAYTDTVVIPVDSPFLVGCDDWGPASPGDGFDGTVAKAAFYTHALTGARILAHRIVMIGGSDPGEGWPSESTGETAFGSTDILTPR